MPPSSRTSKQSKRQQATGAWGKPDPWGPKVYKWEESWPDWNRGTISLQKCRDLVKAACAAYNLRAPPVRQHEGKATSFLSVDDKDPNAWFISMRLDHKNPAMVLHEAAHYICDRFHGVRSTQDHGVTWQGYYFFLLARADLAPLEALKATAAKYGLRWHETPP